MRLTIPKTVNVIELENAPFKCAKDADAWARSHGIVGLMSNVDTAGKGEIAISVHSLNKMLSGSALEKSSTPALHFAALMRLRDIIRESFVGEVHPDYIKVDGKRSPDNGINPLVEIWVLYGCASFADFPCRVKTTLKRFLDNNFPSKAYSYEISNIEILRGTAAPVARPSNKISMDVSILLNGVCDVNGTPLLCWPKFKVRLLERAKLDSFGRAKLDTLSSRKGRGAIDFQAISH